MGQAPRELQAYESVLAFFGSELRLWRQRRGLSQDQLAAQVHVSGDLVARIEKAQRRPSADFADRCDRVLKTDGALARLWPLTLRPGVCGSVAVTSAPWAGTVSVAAVDPRGVTETLDPADSTSRRKLDNGEDNGDEAGVHRRALLGLAGASTVGLLAPPLVCSWSDLGEYTEIDVDPLTVGQLRAQTEGLRWLDRQDGSYLYLAVAARHAYQIARLRRQLRLDHPLRNELADIAADACHLVAFQVFDQGRRGTAIDWYRASASLAAIAGKQELYVFAMCGVAFMHTKAAVPEVAMARSVLDQLAELPLQASSACYLQTYRAHALAADGDLYSARRALDHAEHLAGRSSEAQTSWLGVPDTAWVARQRAIVLSQHGHGEALAILDDLERRTPSVFHRYRITMTCDRALIHAHAGEVAHAAELLIRALELNVVTRSEEKHRRVLATRRVLEHAAASPAVRALDQALHDVGPVDPG